MLKKSKRIRELVALKYPFLILDEFQDMDADQWEVVSTLGTNRGIPGPLENRPPIAASCLDDVAVLLVWRYPVSAKIPLFTGNLQGNSPVLAQYRRNLGV